MDKSILNSAYLILAATLLFCCLLGVSVGDTFDDSEIRHIHYPDWFSANPFLDLAEELESAQSHQKKGLLVLFTTNGCSYCDLFIRKSLGDAEIANTVQQHFESIGMEIFDDAEMVDPSGNSMPVKQFAKQQGVQFSPSLLFYDYEGNRILRLTGYQTPSRFTKVLTYLVNGHYDALSLRDYLASQEKTTKPANQLKSDALFEKPPYALDRRHAPAVQPLLVIFESTHCQWCDNFHSQVLADQKIRETLKRFDVVRFDAQDKKTPVITPTGQRTTPSDWYLSTEFSQLPALLFFDENGNQVLQTDALVLNQRMMNSLNFVLERAYLKDWTYQRFARTKSLERIQQQRNQSN